MRHSRAPFGLEAPRRFFLLKRQAELVQPLQGKPGPFPGLDRSAERLASVRRRPPMYGCLAWLPSAKHRHRGYEAIRNPRPHRCLLRIGGLSEKSGPSSVFVAGKRRTSPDCGLNGPARTRHAASVPSETRFDCSRCGERRVQAGTHEDVGTSILPVSCRLLGHRATAGKSSDEVAPAPDTPRRLRDATAIARTSLGRGAQPDRWIAAADR
jgi:hypothetical protein